MRSRSTIAQGSAPRSLRSFTLLEILVVIGIIVIVASLVLAVSSAVARAGEQRKTEAALSTLTAAVEEYERAIDRRVTNYVTVNGTGVSPLTEFWDVQQAPVAPPLPPPPTTYTWGALPNPYAVISPPGDVPHPRMEPMRRTAYLIDMMSKQPSTQAMLMQLPADMYRRMQRPGLTAPTYYELKEVVDAWGNQIVAVFPGREWVPADQTAWGAPNADGTLHTPGEKPNSGASAGMDVVCRDRKVLFVSAGPNGKFLKPLPGQTISTIRDDDNLYSYAP